MTIDINSLCEELEDIEDKLTLFKINWKKFTKSKKNIESIESALNEMHFMGTESAKGKAEFVIERPGDILSKINVLKYFIKQLKETELV